MIVDGAVDILWSLDVPQCFAVVPTAWHRFSCGLQPVVSREEVSHLALTFCSRKERLDGMVCHPSHLCLCRSGELSPS